MLIVTSKLSHACETRSIDPYTFVSVLALSAMSSAYRAYRSWRSTGDTLLLQISSGVVWQSRDLQLSGNTLYLLSPHLCFFIILKT